MPRPARCLAAALAVAALAGCSYSSGTLAGPSSTVSRAGPGPTTTVPQGPLVGTLPPITQPGQTAPPQVTAPPETAAAETVPATIAVTPDDATATTAKPRRTPTTAVTEPATTTVLAGRPGASTTVPPTTAGPVVVGVQAGAYSDKASAEKGLSLLAAKGFSGFALSGNGPYRLVRVPLTKQAADKLVAQLGSAGWSALTFTRPA